MLDVGYQNGVAYRDFPEDEEGHNTKVANVLPTYRKICGKWHGPKASLLDEDVMIES